MRTRVLTPNTLLAVPFTAFLLGLSLAATPADAESGMPSGGDQVVLGRLFHRGPEGTLPVARFGLVIGQSASSTTRLEVPSRTGESAAGYSLEITAEGRRGAVRIDWTLQPSGAVGLASSRGSQEILSGVLGHLSIAQAEATQIYASLEFGRASTFDVLKLARHFGVDVGGPSVAAAPPSPSPAAAAPAETARRAVATPIDASTEAAPSSSAPPSPSSEILRLSFQLLQDGEVAFAPRVRVRSGQAFELRGGQALEAAGARWDGFELSGLARLQGSTCLIDLAVQSGRSLAGDAAPTWLVDRYRRDIAVRLGVESELALFEDLAGGEGGALSLLITCEGE